MTITTTVGRTLLGVAAATALIGGGAGIAAAQSPALTHVGIATVLDSQQSQAPRSAPQIPLNPHIDPRLPVNPNITLPHPPLTCPIGGCPVPNPNPNPNPDDGSTGGGTNPGGGTTDDSTTGDDSATIDDSAPDAAPQPAPADDNGRIRFDTGDESSTLPLALAGAGAVVVLGGAAATGVIVGRRRQR